MRMRVLAVGTRMPAWVDEVFRDYAQRMARTLPLELRELAAAPRGKAGKGTRAVELEAERLLAEQLYRAHTLLAGHPYHRA